MIVALVALLAVAPVGPGVAPTTAASPGDEALQVLPEAEQNDRRAREAWRQGTLAYEEGRLVDAIRAFEETYRYSGRSGPLFSLGQAHRHRYEREGDPRQRHLAVVRFQQYLEVDPEGSRKVEAERYLAELRPLSELELEGLGDPRILTRLSLSSAVEGATVRVDGGEPLTLPAALDVEPGEHQVLVRAPGYEDWSRSVVVPEGSTVAPELRLSELGARLTIAGPPGSDVYVDGQRVARLPVARGVALTPGVHQIGVARAGRSLWVRELALGRGESRRLEATLEVTGQRKVAWVAMAVGGAAVVASATAMGLALRAQAQAQLIADARDAGSIELAEEQRRRELIDRRDTMRNAAIGAGVSGLALVVTGVLLYFADRPPVGSQLQRPERRRTAAITGGPQINGTYAGAAIAGSF